MKINWKKEIKWPSLRRPKALSAGPSIKLPRVVTDLYADLRDRHLLPLVALLIVAIIGAPILLNKSSDKKQPPIAAVGGISGGEAPVSSFTVVPATRRLRSPEKRLGHRTALDPFRIEKKKSNGGGAAGEAGVGESPTAVGAPSGGGAELPPGRNAEIKVTESPTGDKELTIKESSSTTTTTTTPPPNEPSGSGSTTGSPGSGSGSTTTTTEGTGGQSEVVGYTVDLKTGDPSGELTEENEVTPMTKLPTAKNPLVVFVGLSQDNKRALFLMTSNVTGYYGAVHCVVDAQACQMVELKVGHPALFEYTAGETEAEYKVVLEKIEPVVKSQSSIEREKTIRETTGEPPAETQGGQPAARAYSIGAAHRFSK